MGHDRTPLGVGTSVRLSVFFWVAVFFVPGPVTLSDGLSYQRFGPWFRFGRLVGIENLFILRVGVVGQSRHGTRPYPLGGGYVRPFVRFLLGSGLFRSGSGHVVRAV